jgi:predicted RNA-binding protein with RPS1 domain
VAARQASVGSAVGGRRSDREGPEVRPGEEPRLAGLKQLGEDPWVGLSRRYPPGTRLFGKVTNITDYGAFVEIESGIEGLVHVSEMDWTNKNIHPTKVVQLGDEVEVMILEIDEDRRRISLGMKQCMPNPWEEFSMNHKKGDRVKGQIKSITDFGVFVGLPGGIDGLVHLSDLSWNAAGETAVRDYKKAQEVEAVVLAIDVERERISLGIKQLEGDPFTNFVATHDKGSVVTGAVKSLDPKGAVVSLGGDIEGYLRASEVSRDRVEDIRTRLKEGDNVSAMIINIDRKNRSINLSIKAKDNAEESEAMQRMSAENSAPTPARRTLARYSRPSSTTRTRLEDERAMTKSELIDRLAAQFPQLVAKDAELAVKMILDAMARSLAKGSASRSAGSAASASTTGRRARDAIPRAARRCRCPRSTCRTSRPARSCASGSIQEVRRRLDDSFDNRRATVRSGECTAVFLLQGR